MERIARGRKHDVELATGALGDVVEKVTPRSAREPVALDVDPRSVGELEAADIDGVAERVLAQSSASAALAAALIGAVVPNEDDRTTEVTLRGLLHHLALEAVESGRQGAAHLGGAVPPEGPFLDPGGVCDVAALPRGPVRHRGEMVTFAAKS